MSLVALLHILPFVCLTLSLVSVVFTNQPYKISVFVSVTAQFALVCIDCVLLTVLHLASSPRSRVVPAKCEIITKFFFQFLQFLFSCDDIFKVNRDTSGVL